MTKSNVYVYLARLDKKGIKVLATMSHNTKVYPTRVNDVRTLGLSRDLAHRVAAEQNQNRMDYELFVESAPSFESLKKSLTERGYNNLPIQSFTGHYSSLQINKHALVTASSTMLRRSSSVK